MEWVGQYQLVQEDTDHVRLLVRPTRAVTDQQLEALRRKVQDRCGPQVRAEVVLASDIPLADNGKYRVAYSKLTRP
jgi:hypothetical protein